MLTGQAVCVTAVAQTDVEVLGGPHRPAQEAVTQAQVPGTLILRALHPGRQHPRRPRRRPPDHSARAPRRTPAACGTSPAATGSRAAGRTWRRIRTPRAPAGVRHPTRPDTRRDLEGTDGPAQPQQHRARRPPRAARTRAAARRTTSWWWAPAGRAGRGGRTPHPKGSPRSSLDAVAQGGRRPRRPRSRTTWASRPASRAPSSPTARWFRPARIGATFSVPGEATSLTQADGYPWWGWRRGDDPIVTPCPPWACATDVSTFPGWTVSSAAAFYYAATEYEARLCRQDPVTVVGGGNSAGQAACFLARRSPVGSTWSSGHDDLGRDISRYLADRVEQSPRIKVWRNSRGGASSIGTKRSTRSCSTISHTDAKQRVATTTPVRADRSVPHTSWLRGRSRWTRRASCSPAPAARPPRRHVRDPSTGVRGGRRTDGSVKRVASAVGEGSVAIRQVHQFSRGSKGSRPPTRHETRRNRSDHLQGRLLRRQPRRRRRSTASCPGPSSGWPRTTLSSREIPIGNLPPTARTSTATTRPRLGTQGAIAAVGRDPLRHPRVQPLHPRTRSRTAIDWASRPGDRTPSTTSRPR